MKTTNDIFAGSDASLTEVIILPVGSHGAGSYSLPAGDMWTDYESVEIIQGEDATPNVNYQTFTLSKEMITSYPTNFSLLLRGGTTTTNNKEARVIATGINSFDISGVVNNGSINQIKAYKKKYTTRNLSKVVSVNGGADIAIDSRYEIDIATMLGSEYLNRDLIVEVEIYASGSNYTGWGKAPSIERYDAGGTTVVVRGVNVAEKDGGKIEVFSGADGLVNAGTTNLWGVGSNLLSAPCRIKVWKVDEYLPATRSSGDITTIWTGSAGHGATVDWSGTGYVLSQFDAIRFTSDVSGYEDSREFPPSRLLSVLSALVGGQYIVNERWASADSITETSLILGSTGSVSLTGIYGINYS